MSAVGTFVPTPSSKLRRFHYKNSGTAFAVDDGDAKKEQSVGGANTGGVKLYRNIKNM